VLGVVGGGGDPAQGGVWVPPGGVVGLGPGKVGGNFPLLPVNERTCLVLPRFAPQPPKNTRGVRGVPGARRAVPCPGGGGVGLGNGTPVHVAIRLACPALDAGEEPLDAWAVAADEVAIMGLLIEDRVSLGIPDQIALWILLEHRHQILCAGQDENVRLVSIVVL